MAPTVLPLLDTLIEGFAIDQVVDHGERLIEWIAEDTLDAAIVALAEQVVLPKAVRVTHIGMDRLVVFAAKDVATPRSGRRGFAGTQVAWASYDYSGPHVAERLSRLGADTRRAALTQTAVEAARRNSHLAVVPASSVAASLKPGESIHNLPFRATIRLSMITGPVAPSPLITAIPKIQDELRLTANRTNHV
jgi:hypothetical protein